MARRAPEETVATVSVQYSGEGTRTFRAMGQLYKFGTDPSHAEKRIPVEVATELVAQQPEFLSIVDGSLTDPNAEEAQDQTVTDEPEEEATVSTELEPAAPAQDAPPSPPEPAAEEAPASEEEEEEEPTPEAPASEEVSEPAPAPAPRRRRRTAPSA